MLIRTTLVAVLALAAGAYAQPPGRGGGRGRFGPEDRVAPPEARLIGAVAGNPRHIVRNAPYSADMVTEMTQTLADGNHIRQTTNAKIFRDAEGRVRDEQSLTGLGALAPNADLPRVAFINDPVAGVNYALNLRAKTGTKSVWNRRGPAASRPRGGPGPDAASRGGRRGPGGERLGPPNIKTESLGKQTMEGLAVEGTRTTVVIPAGQMGNEQPISIVSESWYSPELQVIVYSKHTDPRAGETVFRLTNVTREAPPASLFQPPSDFQVTEAAQGRR